MNMKKIYKGVSVSREGAVVPARPDAETAQVGWETKVTAICECEYTEDEIVEAEAAIKEELDALLTEVDNILRNRRK